MKLEIKALFALDWFFFSYIFKYCSTCKDIASYFLFSFSFKIIDSSNNLIHKAKRNTFLLTVRYLI